MIAAQLYQPIYLLLVTVLSLFIYNIYHTKNTTKHQSTYYDSALLILVGFLIVFIGFRPESGRYFVDMGGYVQNYYTFFDGTPFTFDWDTDNILFDNYFAFVGSLRLGTTFFFVTIAIIYFGASYIGIKKMFSNDAMAAYLVFLGAFSTFSYATNGIKAGVAASLFILAIAYRENLKLCIPLVLLTYGFHHSMLLPIAAFILTLIYKNPKTYYVAWCVSVLISAAHITFFQGLFASMTADTMNDEWGASYLHATDSNWGGKSGFRIDFILYSAMPVLVGYWAMFKKKIRLSKLYTCLLNIYLCTNGIWMLCMYAEFTNRIAYLSWFLYPIVLCYPFLNENWGPTKYKTFSKVMLAQLGFTLFMELVYYA